MSFLKDLTLKLSSSVAPIEQPDNHTLQLLQVADILVTEFPLPKPKQSIVNIGIPRTEVNISKNFQPAFSPARVLRITKGLLPPVKTGPNLLFQINEITSNSYFSKPKSVGISNLKVNFDVFVSDDIYQNVQSPQIGKNLFENLEAPIISHDLIDELFRFPQKTEISENLFRRLLAQKVNGKSYDKKGRTQPEQPDLFSQNVKPKQKSNDFVKAYKREKTQGSISSHQTKSLTFWDLLYPILLPPLDVNFNSQFELFAPLFKFQPAGIEFLVKNESALLADEMGTGKTVMSSVALKLLFRLGKAKKALIISPVSLLKTWQDHLLNWADELELTAVRGTPEVRKLDWSYNAHVYLTTYDTIASDFLTKIKRHHKFTCPKCKLNLNLGNKITLEDEDLPNYSCPKCKVILNDYIIKNLPKKSSIVDPSIFESFDVVLIDEAQYIKNKSSDRSRAVRLLKPRYKWALTGTPIENRLDDLVSIFSFVKPKLFNNDSVSPRRAAELIKPYFLRRLKKDVMKDLPPKVIQEIWLELDDDQMKAYKSVEQAGVKEIEDLGGRVTKLHIFSLIGKLKQICNFAPGKTKSSKTEELLDLVEQIKANGQKVIVFSQYDVEGVAKLEKLLQPFGVSLLKGGMSDAARNMAIERFKKDPSIAVFLATIKTGGVGLTLTEASYVIHFDHWWNPALMWQANDRVHRSGQKSSQVNIYSFWMQGTIEERIHFILKEKGLLFDEVINGLSVDDVDEMFSIDDWLEVLGIKTSRRNTESSRTRETSSHRHHNSTNTRSNQTSGQERKEDDQKSNKSSGQKQSNQSQNPSYAYFSDELTFAFSVLEIPPYSTKDLIIKAYRDLMKIHHPDKVGKGSSDSIKRAEEKSKQINAAYAILKKHKYV
ncbi:MAG: DnaJ domain-containing protein [Acidobacteria bacterium]|nr:DnaJ domain-containing protein [Acidobacteriota bacterium]